MSVPASKPKYAVETMEAQPSTMNRIDQSRRGAYSSGGIVVHRIPLIHTGS